MIALDGHGSAGQARGAMDAKRAALADFGALHRAASAALLDWAERNFEQGGTLLDDQPPGWPALAPATVARKRRVGQSAAPLVVTGRLRASFAAVVTGEQGTVANRAPYARFHQDGAGVPRRAILPEPAQAVRILWPAVLSHVREALA